MRYRLIKQAIQLAPARLAAHLGLGVESFQKAHDGSRIVPLEHRRPVEDHGLFGRCKRLDSATENSGGTWSHVRVNPSVGYTVPPNPGQCDINPTFPSSSHHARLQTKRS